MVYPTNSTPMTLDVDETINNGTVERPGPSATPFDSGLVGVASVCRVTPNIQPPPPQPTTTTTTTAIGYGKFHSTETPTPIENADWPSPNQLTLTTNERPSSGRARNGGRKKSNEDHLPPEERERNEQRRKKNREAAAKCRQKKLDQIENLTRQVEALKGQNMELRLKLDKLTNKLVIDRKIVQSHLANCSHPDELGTILDGPISSPLSSRIVGQSNSYRPTSGVKVLKQEPKELYVAVNPSSSSCSSLSAGYPLSSSAPNGTLAEPFFGMTSTTSGNSSFLQIDGLTPRSQSSLFPINVNSVNNSGQNSSTIAQLIDVQSLNGCTSASTRTPKNTGVHGMGSRDNTLFTPSFTMTSPSSTSSYPSLFSPVANLTEL